MNALCIKCWNPDAVVKMSLVEEWGFECAECGEEFTCEEVKEAIEAMQKGWGRLLKWAESYPKDA